MFDLCFIDFGVCGVMLCLWFLDLWVAVGCLFWLRYLGLFLLLLFVVYCGSSCLHSFCVDWWLLVLFWLLVWFVCLLWVYVCLGLFGGGFIILLMIGGGVGCYLACLCCFIGAFGWVVCVLLLLFVCMVDYFCFVWVTDRCDGITAWFGNFLFGLFNSVVLFRLLMVWFSCLSNVCLCVWLLYCLIAVYVVFTGLVLIWLWVGWSLLFV